MSHLIRVCNPITRKFKILPELPKGIGGVSSYFWKLSYDAFIGRYKVVGLGTCDKSRGRSFVLELRAETTEWKEFQFSLHSTHVVVEVSTCIVGKLLLLTEDEGEVFNTVSKGSLVLLDVSKGEFRVSTCSIFNMHTSSFDASICLTGSNGTFLFVVPVGDSSDEFDLRTLKGLGFDDEPTWACETTFLQKLPTSMTFYRESTESWRLHGLLLHHFTSSGHQVDFL